ncbi:MAG: RHS repeat-associated core domain-containing protein [Pseudomonadales bacterium]|nr:RHS repeat-associated core domain-containing protein [Pseudomonadales bacterium]
MSHQQQTTDYGYDALDRMANYTVTDQQSGDSVATVYTFYDSYNSRDQLLSVATGDVGAEIGQGSYDYNFAGMRIRHLGSERGSVEYIYDGNAVIEELVSGSSNLLAHYRYADRLLSLNTPLETQFYLFASLGTTANLSDEAGVVAKSYRVDPFGEITHQEGNSVNKQVFTGQEHDENTGLIYFGARYYDPDTARFITQDSYLGESDVAPSLHRYLYAYGNPGVWVDPTGNANEAGHFYAGYNAAQIVGLPSDFALSYALRVQVPDELTQFDAIHNSTSLNSIINYNDFKANNCGNHGLCGAKVLRELVTGAAQISIYNPENSFEELAARGHVLADSQWHYFKSSHDKSLGVRAGHLKVKDFLPFTKDLGHGRDVDQAYLHKNKYAASLQLQVDALYSWASRNSMTSLTREQIGRRFDTSVSTFNSSQTKAIASLTKENMGLLDAEEHASIKAARQHSINQHGFRSSIKPEYHDASINLMGLLGGSNNKSGNNPGLSDEELINLSPILRGLDWGDGKLNRNVRQFAIDRFTNDVINSQVEANIDVHSLVEGLNDAANEK